MMWAKEPLISVCMMTESCTINGLLTVHTGAIPACLNSIVLKAFRSTCNTGTTAHTTSSSLMRISDLCSTQNITLSRKCSNVPTVKRPSAVDHTFIGMFGSDTIIYLHDISNDNFTLSNGQANLTATFRCGTCGQTFPTIQELLTLFQQSNTYI